MHFGLVLQSLPQPSTNGGPMTCWAVMNRILQAGHRVTACCLVEKGDPFNTPERRSGIEQLGVRVHVVPMVPERPREERAAGRRAVHWLRRIVHGDLSGDFPSHAQAPLVEELLARDRPDAVFVYHWEPLAAMYGVRVAPRMAAVGDPWHLPALRRWQRTRPVPTRAYARSTLETVRSLYHQPRFMVRLLNDCDRSACFQAQAAAWLRRRGARECAYLRSPIMDEAGDDLWERRRQRAASNAKPRILLGPSALGTTSTRAGLVLFATGILPHLERELGGDGFEVHVVGEGDPPPELARLLPRPSVKVRGRVEPADDEFLAADIQLVPTPFVLGIRLRIVTGFSFGCCVVAHTSEAANIPEMVHGENALLAADGPGLAREILRAVHDRELRARLARNARATYTRYFTPDAAATPILATLERLADEDRRRRVSQPAASRT